jgi:hypothetical protein
VCPEFSPRVQPVVVKISSSLGQIIPTHTVNECRNFRAENMFMNFSLSFERQTPFRVRLSLIFFSYFPALAVSRFAKLVLV